MPISQVPRELMAQLPPGATPVDAVKVPGGEGYWVLGADGGVFAVGGAPFMGSYTGLAPEQRQGTRNFTTIIPRGPEGYILVSNRGELYNLGKDTPIQQPSVTPPSVESVKVDEKESAKVWLRGQLDQFGLGALGDWALDRFNKLGGGEAAANAVMIEMRQQEPYRQRFKGMAVREKNGFGPMTEAQYIEWEDTYKRMMQNAGMPEGFYDSDDDFVELIGKNVAPTEVKDRIDRGYMAAMSAPNEVRAQLKNFFGIDEKQLAAFFLDPTKAEDIWTKNLTQAQIAGAAQIQKFGQLSERETARLAEQGMDFRSASERFGVLSQQTELFEDLGGEGGVTREEQLQAAAGEADAMAKIDKQAQRRKATFSGGGGFAGGQGGVAGLGEAT